MKRVVSIEMNEVNFDFVAEYAGQGKLPTFAKLLGECQRFETISERAYPHIEPWIQWPTVYTGLSYEEHGIFRLGDSTSKDHPQIWEVLEERGATVGAISPMNAVNRCSNPDFFLPDPWTETRVSGDRSLASMFELVREVVNANAHGGGGMMKIARSLVPYLVRYSALSSSREYARILRMSRRYKWARATFLDRFLADVFIKLVTDKKTQFATLFLNSGAHIQHHHMFESAVYEGEHANPDWYSTAKSNGVDPLLFAYRVYDGILADMLALPDTRVLLTTGLSQVPNPRIIYQHRFVDHAAGLKKLSVQDFEIMPRMSRDFLLNFATREALEAAAACMSQYRCGDEHLFSIDDRGDSLFCQIGYFGPPEGLREVRGTSGEPIDLSNDTVLVSIENGIHRTVGFHFDTAIPRLASGDGAAVEIPLTDVFGRMVNMFEEKPQQQALAA